MDQQGELRLRMGVRPRVPLWVALAMVLAGSADAQDVRITEFLAFNRAGLRDSDGETSDWIELQNRGNTSVDLSGWFLTDAQDKLRRWRVPEGVRLQPREARVVFASGKDRRDPSAELHTNFDLSRKGEFLALVHPDGETIANGFMPSYPPQRRDISYGTRQDLLETSLVTPRSPARLLVGTTPSPGWEKPDFDASAWTEARSGVGFFPPAEAAPLPRPGSNLALGGVASQSSVDKGGTADRAIDGNTDGIFENGSVAYTAPHDEAPFWQVDLQASYYLDGIVLWNRTDWCSSKRWNRKVDNCLESLTNFRLSVLETDGSGGERIVVAKDYFTDLTTFERQAHRIDFPAGTRGRIVRLEKLGPNRRGVYPFSIAEVEVLAGSPPRRPWIEHSTAALMQGKATRAYLRVPLGVPGPTAEDLRLRMRFDDSFVAYLNGQEVARQDLPPTAAGVAPPARRTENEVAQPKEFSLTALLGSLQGAAKGMLAIEGRNSAVNDSGFLLAPTLLARHVSDGDPGYFTTPTPGELNATVAVTGFLEELRCSPERGFYEKPFVATLTGLAPASGGYQIRYTVDGSEPTGTNGVVYDGSIPIQTTIVLRAAAFCPGYARGPIVTQTFIFLDDVPDQKGHGLPPKWDRYPGAYTFRREGISTAGGKEKVVAGLRSLPTLSIVMKPEDLFGPRGIYTKSKARGKDWERPCSMEWFQPTSSPTVQIDCGVRIFGFSSRSHSGFAKHSFRLLFKRKYGATKLRFPLFPDWPIQAFDDIVLRAQGRADPRGPRGEFSFCQHLRDAFARYSARDMGKLTTAATHVHLYLNGLYWGLYNPIERPDAEFMANHLGGEREDYDALNARVGLIEVVDGSQAAWSEVMELSRGNVASKALYAELERRVNLPDLINYILLNFFLGSEDWPGSGMGRTGNNMRVAGSPKNGVPFRAFVWDMENSVRHLRRDSLRIHTHKQTPATLFVRLLENAAFRDQVAKHVKRHFHGDGALTPAHTVARWRRLKESIAAAIPSETARWGGWKRRQRLVHQQHWNAEQTWLLESYLPQRTQVVLEQLRNHGIYTGK